MNNVYKLNMKISDNINIQNAYEYLYNIGYNKDYTKRYEKIIVDNKWFPDVSNNTINDWVQISSRLFLYNRIDKENPSIWTEKIDKMLAKQVKKYHAIDPYFIRSIIKTYNLESLPH